MVFSKTMARGWESKSVEMQMEERADTPVPPGNTIEDAELQRKRELLELSRKRLVEEIERSPGERFREMKRRALRHIESEIAAIPPR
ncbi:MAG: hypothetical protein KGN84_17925 [Acidobacteriota bacterium]|nr:hypothetical protein [Acidobacteriota bacterium]